MCCTSPQRGSWHPRFHPPILVTALVQLVPETKQKKPNSTELGFFISADIRLRKPFKAPILDLLFGPHFLEKYWLFQLKFLAHPFKSSKQGWQRQSKPFQPQPTTAPHCTRVRFLENKKTFNLRIGHWKSTYIRTHAHAHAREHTITHIDRQTHAHKHAVTPK